MLKREPEFVLNQLSVHILLFDPDLLNHFGLFVRRWNQGAVEKKENAAEKGAEEKEGSGQLEKADPRTFKCDDLIVSRQHSQR